MSIAQNTLVKFSVSEICSTSDTETLVAGGSCSTSSAAVMISAKEIDLADHDETLVAGGSCSTSSAAVSVSMTQIVEESPEA